MSASRTGSTKPPSTIPSASAGRVQNSAWRWARFSSASRMAASCSSAHARSMASTDRFAARRRSSTECFCALATRSASMVARAESSSCCGSRCMAPVMTRAFSGLMPGWSMACRVAGAFWSSWASFTSRAASRWADARGLRDPRLGRRRALTLGHVGGMRRGGGVHQHGLGGADHRLGRGDDLRQIGPVEAVRRERERRARPRPVGVRRSTRAPPAHDHGWVLSSLPGCPREGPKASSDDSCCIRRSQLCSSIPCWSEGCKAFRGPYSRRVLRTCVFGTPIARRVHSRDMRVIARFVVTARCGRRARRVR